MQHAVRLETRAEQTGEAGRYHTDVTVASRLAAQSLPRLADRPVQVVEDGDEGSIAPPSAAIWDWEAPDLVDEDTGWYYEPQGELLTVGKEKDGGAKEFSIPEAVAGSGVSWSASNQLQSRRSPHGSSAPGSGLKRKVAMEPESRGSDPKRVSRSVTQVAGSPDKQDGDQASPQGSNNREGRARAHSVVNASSKPTQTLASPRRTLTDPSTPMLLPARKVFPIQIGDKLFRLSGASISSDGEYRHTRDSRLRLTLLEHPHISRSSSKSNFGRMKAPIA